MAVETSKRINVTFPLSLLEQLRDYIPRRQRNKFIVEATENELRKILLHAALDESAGAWSDEDYPHLMNVEDVNQYVRELRSFAMPRSWDEHAEEMPEDE